jgi:glycosyltransferase involved in cell wall biosynthesis
MSEVWSRSGHTREVVTLDSTTDPWLSSLPITIHALGSRSANYRRLKRLVPWLRYGFSPSLLLWLRANVQSYDAVVINGLWSFCSLAAWLSLRRTLTPYFVFTHGSLDPWFRRRYPIKHIFKQMFWYLIEFRIMRDATAVLFTAEDEKLLAYNSFVPYQCNPVVVGYGTRDPPNDAARQIEIFYELYPRLRGRHFLLFLSRIHPKKGCDLLIRAFARHAAMNPGLDIVIAGPDPLSWSNELKALAKDLDVADRLIWTGMLTGDAKWGAYRASDAFILPSHSENFGIVVAEAMACGRPVLITEKINIWREIDSVGAGFVGPDTVDGIDQIISRFFTLTENERTMMGERARAAFLQYFDINKVCAVLLNLMQASARKPFPNHFK